MNMSSRKIVTHNKITENGYVLNYVQVSNVIIVVDFPPPHPTQMSCLLLEQPDQSLCKYEETTFKENEGKTLL